MTAGGQVQAPAENPHLKNIQMQVEKNNILLLRTRGMSHMDRGNKVHQSVTSRTPFAKEKAQYARDLAEAKKQEVLRQK